MPHKLINGVRVPVEAPEKANHFQGVKAKSKAKAIAADNSSVDPSQTQNAGGGSAGGKKQGKKMSLKKAIESLNPADVSHWTKTGLPDLRTLIELTGQRLQRADVERTKPGWTKTDAEVLAASKDNTPTEFPG